MLLQMYNALMIISILIQIKNKAEVEKWQQ